MLSIIRRTTVVLPEPEPPATPITSGAGRGRVVAGPLVSIDPAHHFTTLYVRARSRIVFMSIRGRTDGTRPADLSWRAEPISAGGLLRCGRPPQPVTPCGGRRRAPFRAIAGGNSVRPADCVLGRRTPNPVAGRGTVAHD